MNERDQHGLAADEAQLRRDYDKVLGDVAEAIATGREPEDVQRERHERERQAARRPFWDLRWWR